jgi:hypothetical protein
MSAALPPRSPPKTRSGPPRDRSPEHFAVAGLRHRALLQAEVIEARHALGPALEENPAVNRAAIGTSLGRGETDFSTPRLADKTLIALLNGGSMAAGVGWRSGVLRSNLASSFGSLVAATISVRSGFPGRHECEIAFEPNALRGAFRLE